MAVNLKNSNDIEIEQTNDDIKLNFSTTRNTQLDDIEQNIGNIETSLSEVITNGNGYVKYADGTLICYGKTAKANINASSEYLENITLPYSYLSSDFVVLASVTSGGSGWAGIVARGGATDVNKIRIIAGNYILQYSASDIILSYITIGKWK